MLRSVELVGAGERGKTVWREGAEIANRIRAWERGETPGPYTLELYPTLRCNMRCVFCDTRYRDPRRHDELSPADLQTIVEQAAEMDVRRVMLLGGGEPLLARATAPLLSSIKDAGMEGVLSTNGLLLDDSMATTLVTLGWDEVQLSVDSAEPRVNDYLRGTPGGLARVSRHICQLSGHRRLSGGGLPRVLIHAVLTCKNVRGLTRLVELTAALGAYRLNVDILIAYRPEQRALQLTDTDLDLLPELAAQAIAAAEQLGIETNIEQLTDPRSTQRGEMTLPDDGPRTVRHAPCLNPWYYLVVDAAGSASPCCVITATGEDVRGPGLRETWENGPLFTKLRTSMIHKQPPGRCRECSLSMISRNDELRKLIDEA